MPNFYRVRQFWHAVSSKTDDQPLEQAQAVLTISQWELFMQLQASEQSHSLRMYQKLLTRGETQTDLLVAALLHDIGKLRYPLNPIQRAMIVLVKAIMPPQAHRWGSIPAGGWENLPGWRKAFVVAEQHPAWGAALARDAGVSALTEALIRQHHCPPNQGAAVDQDMLLQKLWLVDNES